jgi:hypothetical protein
MEINQQKIQQDIDSFDIDDALFNEKDRIESKIKSILIRFEAMKITRGVK